MVSALHHVKRWARIVQSVQRFATGLDGPGSDTGEGGIFRSCQRGSGRPSSILHKGYQVSFPRVK